MNSPETPDRDLGPDARDLELARLRSELAHLKETVPPEKHSRRRGWWRSVVCGLLVAMAALLAPLSVLATWAQGQVEDTDRYVETVSPLASDPDVQDAIAARVEQVVYSYLDVDAATDQIVEALSTRDLPPSVEVALQAASGPLAAGIRSFVSDRIAALVRSDVFQQAWTEANRTAHAEVVAALTGGGGDSLSIEDGAVQVDLAPLIQTLKQQLTTAGFTIADRIPEVPVSYTLIQSDDLGTVQQLLGLLDSLSTWLPVIALILLGAAIVIARDRRRVVLAAGLAVAGSMLLLGATLNIIRPFYLDALPASASTAAAGVVYDQVVSFIRFALRGVLIVALAVALAAWLSARTGAGAAARRAIVHGIDGLRNGTSRAGLRTGRLGIALSEYRTAARVAIVGVPALIYLMQDHPTTGTALTLVIVTGVLLVVMEVLAAPQLDSPAVGDPAGSSLAGS